jgi:uncharacterized membrane protein YdjX (TVP38/TMEM64 family)
MEADRSLIGMPHRDVWGLADAGQPRASGDRAGMTWLTDKRVLIAAALGAILLAAHGLGLTDLLSIETLRTHRASLTAFVHEHGAVAALGFLAAYVAAVSLSLPGAAILTLTGGFLFGAWAGAALAVVGATAGATLVFLFARSVFGEDALSRLGPSAAKLAANIGANAWSYLLVLRLAPLFPFFLVNLVPAFAGVRLPVFVATTFLGIIPGTVVFALAGSGLGGALDRDGEFQLSSILTTEIVIGLFGLAALSLAAIPLKKRFAAKDP